MARKFLIGAVGKSVPKAKGFRYVKAKRKVQHYFGLGRYDARVRGARLRSKERANVPLMNIRVFGKKLHIAETKRGQPITGVSPRGRKALGIASRQEKAQRRRRKVAGGTLVGGSIAYAGGAVAISAARRKKKARSAAAARRRIK